MIPPCLTLSIIRYGSRVKWSNPGNGVAPSPTPWCSSYRKGSLRVTLDYGRLTMIYVTTFLLMLYFHLVYISMYFDHFEGSYDIWNHFSFNALFPSGLHLYVLWSFWRKLWYMKPLFFQCSISIWFTFLCTLIILKESYDIWNHFSFNALFPSGLHLYVLWSFRRKLWYMKPLFF